MSEGKLCISCGASIFEKASICPKCGESQASIGEEVVGSQKVESSEEKATGEIDTKASKSKSKYRGLAIRAIVSGLLSSFIVITLSDASYLYVTFENKSASILMGVLAGLLFSKIGKRLFKNRFFSIIFQILGLVLGAIFVSVWAITEFTAF